MNFKELLQQLKVLRHYQESYEYLKKNPKQQVKDISIKESLSVVTERLFHEGLSISKLAKLYSGNISDNTLRKYCNGKMNRKAQSIVFAPIEVKVFAGVSLAYLHMGGDELFDGYIIDETKKIDEPLLVQMMIKNDVRRKSRDRYKKSKLHVVEKK